VEETELYTTPEKEPTGATHHHTVQVEVQVHQNDIGNWIGRAEQMTAAEKMKVLKRVWVPPPHYDFPENGKFTKRKFRPVWLKNYSPWLTYSQKLQGAFCLYCVLFPPPISRGLRVFHRPSND